MKKLLAIAVAVILLLSLVACSSKEEGLPTEVLKNYLDAIGKKDLETAASLTTNPSGNAPDFIFATVDPEVKEFSMATYDTLEYTLGEENISGKTATVETTITVTDFAKTYADVNAQRIQKYADKEITAKELNEGTDQAIINAIQADDAATRTTTVTAKIVKNSEGEWKVDIDSALSSAFGLS